MLGSTKKPSVRSSRDELARVVERDRRAAGVVDEAAHEAVGVVGGARRARPAGATSNGPCGSRRAWTRARASMQDRDPNLPRQARRRTAKRIRAAARSAVPTLAAVPARGRAAPRVQPPGASRDAAAPARRPPSTASSARARRRPGPRERSVKLSAPSARHARRRRAARAARPRTAASAAAPDLAQAGHGARARSSRASSRAEAVERARRAARRSATALSSQPARVARRRQRPPS